MQCHENAVCENCQFIFHSCIIFELGWYQTIVLALLSGQKNTLWYGQPKPREKLEKSCSWIYSREKLHQIIIIFFFSLFLLIYRKQILQVFINLISSSKIVWTAIEVSLLSKNSISFEFYSINSLKIQAKITML